MDAHFTLLYFCALNLCAPIILLVLMSEISLKEQTHLIFAFKSLKQFIVTPRV